MAILRVPSLQHLSRNWRDTPVKVEKELVRLAENSPTFSYNPVYSAISDMLIFNLPYDQIMEGIRRATSREFVRNNYLDLITLIYGHFEGLAPNFVHRVSTRRYPVGRGLMIPFTPPLIYGIGGQIYFPWFSFWRSQPLARENLSLFVTLVYEVLQQDPDLETSKFEILDFSAPKGGAPRELTIIDANDIPIVSEKRKTEMLSIFAEGFLLAQANLANRAAKSTDKSQREETEDVRQQNLFENDRPQ